MALESNTRVIGGYTYCVRQLVAKKARAMSVRLVKIAGPMVVAFACTGSIRSILDVDLSVLAPALRDFFTNLNEADLEYFCAELAACTEIINEQGAAVPMTANLMEAHFTGRLLDTYKWLGFALEVNFSDFFDAAKSLQAAKLPTQAGSAPLPSPPVSIGMSGVS